MSALAEAEDEKTRLKLVEYILKTRTDSVDPSLVAPFMRIDTATLPKKMRNKALAKQIEIESFVKIRKGEKQGPFRYPSQACVPKRYGPEGVAIMAMIPGNMEIETNEEDYLEKRSQCSENQLICEFTLNVVVIPRPGKPALKRYYLYGNDPLMAWVAEYRGRGAIMPTNYFQTLKPTCQQAVTP